MLVRQIVLAVLVSSALAYPAVAQSPSNPPVNPPANAPPNQTPEQAQAEYRQKIKALNWRRAPNTGHIDTVAQIKLTGDLGFLDGPNTKKFLVINGNPPVDNHFTIAPPDIRWFAIFSFDKVGYVKDDEKIDADALLKAMKDDDAPSNERRKQLGLEPLHLDGWFVPPHYDSTTRRLEWGTRLRTPDNEYVVNYTSRILGRAGVMRVILVSSPEDLEKDVKELKAVLKDFDFQPGQRYSEYRQGDMVAEIGLAALVAGAAAAAVAKGGLKGLWKIIAIGAAAVFAAGAGLFRKLFRKKTA